MEVTMDISQIIALLSGVALFMFGMSLMGDGLKKVSGDKLEPILYKLSGTPLRGVLLGTGVTTVIQSSSATAVMIVGFVNAGMMKVSQGISVILGAILGTSITGWVICLSYIDSAGGLASLLSTKTLTGIVAVIGILMRMIGKKQSTKHCGDILMGFVVLMSGMSTMSGSVSSLGDQPWFTNALTSMSNPVLGILAGALFTAVLQSASAAVGIVQALSVTGAMSFQTAFPLLLGISIGASAPVVLTALGAETNGKRVSMSYPIITILGSLAVGSLFYLANAIFHFSFVTMIMNPFSLAGVNTIMRLLMVMILYPFQDMIEALLNILFPDKPDKNAIPKVHLEEMLLSHPAMALEQCRVTMNKMADLTQEGVKLAVEMLQSKNIDHTEEVLKIEQAIDDYEDALGSYLVKMTGQEMTVEQNEEVSKYLHTISDLELISDQALIVAEGVKEARGKFGHFSGNAEYELRVMGSAVDEVAQLAIRAFLNSDLTIAERIEPLEELIDNLCDTMKLNHVDRLRKQICTIDQGFIFNDIITGCERISDHCSNIGIAMIVLGNDSFDMHEYLTNLREGRSSAYEHYYTEYKKKYSIDVASPDEDKDIPFIRSSSPGFSTRTLVNTIMGNRSSF